MSKQSDIRLVRVESETEKFAYRTPLKFGGRVGTDVTLLHVTAEVETRDGRRGTGFGSMPIGHIWGWPAEKVDVEDTERAMIALGQRLAR